MQGLQKGFIHCCDYNFTKLGKGIKPKLTPDFEEDLLKMIKARCKSTAKKFKDLKGVANSSGFINNEELNFYRNAEGKAKLDAWYSDFMKQLETYGRKQCIKSMQSCQQVKISSREQYFVIVAIGQPLGRVDWLDFCTICISKNNNL